MDLSSPDAAVVKLANAKDAPMPLVMLGTWQVEPKVASVVVTAALDAGYKGVDTAAFYGNEEAVGAAVRAHKNGANAFVTSKLKNTDHGYERAKAAIELSLKKLNLGRPLDLYLIHHPGTQGVDPKDHATNLANRLGSWRAMQEAVEAGKIRAIGVSNYTITHLRELIDHKDTRILPAVNQVEFHPRLYQKQLLEYCRSKRVFLQAYSSLGIGYLLQDEQVTAIAKDIGQAVPHVLLRWALQRGVGILPKSASVERVKDNFKVIGASWSISDKHMAQLDALDTSLHFCWDPTEQA